MEQLGHEMMPLWDASFAGGTKPRNFELSRVIRHIINPINFSQRKIFQLYLKGRVTGTSGETSQMVAVAGLFQAAWVQGPRHFGPPVSPGALAGC